MAALRRLRALFGDRDPAEWQPAAQAALDAIARAEHHESLVLLTPYLETLRDWRKRDVADVLAAVDTVTRFVNGMNQSLRAN
jgi:hypothetical protein